MRLQVRFKALRKLASGAVSGKKLAGLADRVADGVAGNEAESCVPSGPVRPFPRVLPAGGLPPPWDLCSPPLPGGPSPAPAGLALSTADRDSGEPIEQG